MEPDDGVRRRAYVESLAAAAALVAVLLALPWHRYAISVAGAGSFALNRSAVQTPNAGSGEAALIVAVLVAAYAAVALAGPRPFAHRLRRADGWLRWAGVAQAVALGFKLLSDTSYLGIGAWISLALGAAVVVFGRHFGRHPGRPPALPEIG